MFRRGSVRLWKRKSARMFQEPSALMSPTGNVVLFPRRNARTFRSSSVFRYPRSTARNLTDNLALKFPRKIVNNRQDVSAHWFPRFLPRRSLNVSAPLTRRKSANLCPRKFAAPSVLLMKCVMMSLRRFAPTNQPQSPSLLMTSSVLMSPQGSVRLPPDKSATMWSSRFQGRLSRLNARLSSFRSVQEALHNPEVDLVALDMETKLFQSNYVKC